MTFVLIFIMLCCFCGIIIGVRMIEIHKTESGVIRIIVMSIGIYQIAIAIIIFALFLKDNYDFKIKEKETESSNRNITCYQEFQSDTKIKFVCEVKK